jgi:hypothetical protein
MDNLVWQKSSFCNNGSCLEVAHRGIALRNSTDPHGPVVVLTIDEWEVFLDGVLNGDFDHLRRWQD